MIFLAGCANLIGFPVLTVRDFFPKKSGLAMSLVISSQTISTVVPVVLDDIMKSYPSTSLGLLMGVYLGAIAVPVGVIFILSLPLERPLSADPVDDTLSVYEKNSSITADHTADNKQPTHTADNKHLDIGVTELRSLHTDDYDIDGRNRKLADFVVAYDDHDDVSTVVATPLPTSPSFVMVARRRLSSEVQEKQTTTSDIKLQDSSDSGMCLAELEASMTLSSAKIPTPPPATRFDWKQFLKEVCTLEFLSFIVFYVITQLQLGYYPTTVLGRNGQGVSDFLGYMGPTQTAWGVMIGFLYDFIGIIWIMFLMIILTILVFALGLVPSDPLQYATAMLYLFAYSYIFTTRYIYVNETFASRNFGTLVGLLGTTSGVTYLINLPFQYPGAFETMYIVYISLCAVSTIAVVVMFLRQRQGYNYRHWGEPAIDKEKVVTMCLSFESGECPSSAIYSNYEKSFVKSGSGRLDTIIAVPEKSSSTKL
eukprot:CAMPEP_0113844136 /NCGR_PEP_ID=MMETSP0372-20130328/84_1 /TAXON_ID=340204 /ORGANISM="Lankesteria abbotti" /LENGTH=480 /DNA_ID=CAMNT_0000813135 /DNA_START=380 /DNA_END=1822 /DNA_ORIENTATION=- /assembly_acc=CAM_ASM_000359